MTQTTNYEKYSTKNPVSRYFLNNFLQMLIAELKKLQPESVLDVGAGEGFILQKLKDQHNATKFEGIEYVDDAIAIGKKLHPDIVIKKGDIYKLPYKDNSFDVVLCTEVLEHLEKPKHALEELLRVSKKYVLLSVPNEPFFTLQRIARGKNLLHLGDHPEHLQRWTSGQFKKFVSKSMNIKNSSYPFPWTMVVGEKQ